MKTIFRVFIITAVVLGSINVASALTYQGNIVYSGFEEVFGTGFGTLDDLLVLQNNSQHAVNETGSVSPNGRTGDATNQSKTYSFQELVNFGILDGSQLLLAYNNNETGSDPDTLLMNFALTVWDADGGEVAATTGTIDNTANNNSNNYSATVQKGQGKAAYVFELDQAAIDLLKPYFDDPTHFFLGATATINGTDDGADGWYIIESQGPVVPEPATLLLVGVGFLSLAVYGKRRSAHSL